MFKVNPKTWYDEFIVLEYSSTSMSMRIKVDAEEPELVLTGKFNRLNETVPISKPTFTLDVKKYKFRMISEVSE